MSKAKSIEYPVPGLQRGIEVLHLLVKQGEADLCMLQKLTCYPRSSLIRILDTLCACGLAEELPQGNVYRPVMRLVPFAADEAFMLRRVRDLTSELAEQSGETAEWFTFSDEGMLMVEHAYPQSQRVRVLASVGQCFRWSRELDAVTAVGRAVGGKSGDDKIKVQVYVKDGVHEQKPVSSLKKRIEAAKANGYDVDPFWNDVGVRRIAVPVMAAGKPLGILALAMSFRPAAPDAWKDCLPVILGAAGRLGGMLSATSG